MIFWTHLMPKSTRDFPTRRSNVHASTERPHATSSVRCFGRRKTAAHDVEFSLPSYLKSLNHLQPAERSRKKIKNHQNTESNSWNDPFCSCPFILTTSAHGLTFAAVLGDPTRFLVGPTRLQSPGSAPSASRASWDSHNVFGPTDHHCHCLYPHMVTLHGEKRAPCSSFETCEAQEKCAHREKTPKTKKNLSCWAWEGMKNL